MQFSTIQPSIPGASAERMESHASGKMRGARAVSIPVKGFKAAVCKKIASIRLKLMSLFEKKSGDIKENRKIDQKQLPENRARELDIREEGSQGCHNNSCCNCHCNTVYTTTTTPEEDCACLLCACFCCFLQAITK